MNRIRTATLSALLFALGAIATSTPSFAADRVPLSASMVAKIESAKRQHPKWFADVERIHADAANGDPRALAQTVVQLQALGPGGLLPALSELAVPPNRSAPARTALWRVALIEAIGKLRDVQAEPTLIWVSERDTEGRVVVAAARALAKLRTDTGFHQVVRLIEQRPELSDALILTLADCRRSSAADYLVARIVEAPNGAISKVAIRSLGQLASSWAWQTADLARTNEGEHVRSVALGALDNAANRGNEAVLAEVRAARSMIE